TANGADGLVEAVDDAPDVDPRRRRLDQQAGIYRRIEEREWAGYARNAHAMTNLEEPVGDRVPVFQHLFIARDAEVKRAPNAEERSGAISIPGAGGGEREIERKLALQVHHRVADWAEAVLI